MRFQTNGHNNTVKETNMASRVQEGGGGMGSSGATRARANSAAAAKTVAPKKLKGPVKVAAKKTSTGAIKINTNPVPVVVKPKKITPPNILQFKGYANLIKIDSAKGSKIKKLAYRKMTSN